MLVAACLDQCPVGLVPFRKLWTLTLKLRMDNDAVCIVWYIIYSNGAYHCILSCLPILCRYKINILLQREISTYFSHFISNLVSNVMQNVPLKLWY